MRMNRRLSILATGILFLVASSTARAQAPNAQVTLELINNTADRICGVIKDMGTASSSEVQGSVNAELSGLAARLASAGIKGTGGITNEAYQGVLRADLGPVLRDLAACKYKVFDSLQAKLLMAASIPPTRPSQTFSVCMGNGGGPSCAGDQVYYTCDQYNAIGGGAQRTYTELGNKLCKYNDNGQEKNGNANVVHLSSVGGGQCGWTRFLVTCTYP
jgi:hypothetical protein